MLWCRLAFLFGVWVVVGVCLLLLLFVCCLYWFDLSLLSCMFSISGCHWVDLVVYLGFVCLVFWLFNLM